MFEIVLFVFDVDCKYNKFQKDYLKIIYIYVQFVIYLEKIKKINIYYLQFMLKFWYNYIGFGIDGVFL